MVYKNFRIICIVRILLLSATIFLFFYTLKSSFLITPFLIGFIILVQIYSFFRYVDKTNRELASFLESIRFSEFTRSFHIEEMGSSFSALSKAFNDVMKDFQAVRSEKEEHFHYLQNIVQNIDVSILAYQRNGHVEMVNKALKKLFQINTLRNVNDLSYLSDELVVTLINLRPGGNYLVKVQDEDDILQLAIYGTEFKIKDKSIILATIKDIQNVLEDQETEAWQKLIRVLTHEIMNSITPIASLSSTLDISLKNMINPDRKELKNPVNIETVKEIQEALQTINKRSTGLLHFVDTYRNLTRIPKPNFKIIKVKSIFRNISLLFEDELKQKNIKLQIKIEPDEIEFSIDEQLLEQVLINLIQNAMQALDNRSNPEIELKAFYNRRGRITIQVIDNGQGILKDVIDKIFIPFFTTKPKGSGIGLSLSRQIMKLHGGTITATSEPDKGTIFTLTF
ncbi:MAG: GHKL domain-containing protein [Bacteroidales bacterium]|nr:GHKL domain-containing protein [Bacteroidales bacterium]